MIDLYCERTGPGLWAEPINAFTNLAFLVAAGFTTLLAARRGALAFDIWILIGLTAAIGVGSGLFHTFATGWAQVLDVVPILLLQIAFLWIYGRRIIGMRPSRLFGTVVLLLAAALAGRQFPHLMNGSLTYVPAFLLLLILGLYHFRNARVERGILLLASGVSALSLFFRTIDLAVCPYIPMGTHFLWHLLNGLLVYLVMRGLMLNLADRGGEAI
ncbi:MAG: ceramidase domain-containing protein [Opitutaceae bacterium]